MADPDEDARALTDSLHEELADLRQDLTNLSGELAEDLARAIVNGKELDGLLQALILRQSNSILSSSMDQAFGLVGDVGASVVGSALGAITDGVSNIFNVNVAAPNPASFRSSETQLAASLSRAVARGQRGL